jgi:hypothetical protein
MGSFLGRSGRAAPRTQVTVQHVSGSQIAVGDGNTLIQLTADGLSQFGHIDNSVALRVREIPVQASSGRAEPVCRDEIISDVANSLSRGMNVQLFGTPGVGRAAIAEAAARRLGTAGIHWVELIAGAEPHTLVSLYQRLVLVFFGMPWFEPEEAVLRAEVTRADLRALIVITDCDLPPGDLVRLLETFPGCTFLLTSRQHTLEHSAGEAYEVDPLTLGQTRELMSRVLGGEPAGLQNLQVDDAWRLAAGQVQHLLQHAAFLERSARRPGPALTSPVPLEEQVAFLITGLTEPARRTLIALATFGVPLEPSLFAPVTGLPAAEGSAAELLSAGLISPLGSAYQIVPDAAKILLTGPERTDPLTAADGLILMLERLDPPDPQLVLAVVRALRAAGHDVQVSRLTRAAAPLALAAGQFDAWIQMAVLGAQSAASSSRRTDLEYFLNEQRTAALLRGDTVAAAAALAALTELLNGHRTTQTATHALTRTRNLTRARRAAHLTHKALSAGHGAGAAVAATAVAAVIVVSVLPTGHRSPGPAPSLSGGFSSVTAVSADDVWAVGCSGGSKCVKPLIVHFNGVTWTPVPAPNLGAPYGLTHVVAASASRAWAVGQFDNGATFLLQWNGSTWTRVHLPNPDVQLTGLVATADGAAWAFGDPTNRQLSGPLAVVLRWNGRTWTQVSYADSGFYYIESMAAVSASDAWMSGYSAVNGAVGTLILHWNGASWTRVPCPDQGGSSEITGMAASSADSAWVSSVGVPGNGVSVLPFLHWNGHTWKAVPNPAPANTSFTGMAAAPAGDAWAVGFTFNGTKHVTRTRTLLLQWNGTDWTRIPTPSAGSFAALESVTAVSGSNAWAVGVSNGKTLILHWNGKEWT